MEPTNLYRHFDRAGTLLYVGISLSAVARLAQHMAASAWRGDISRVEIQTLESREVALREEARAIRLEAPVWNRAGTAQTERGSRELTHRESAISTTLASTPIFAVRDKRVERPYLEHVTVASGNGTQLRFSGEQLDQDDHDVFMLENGLSDRQALIELRWDQSSESYARLRACRARLDRARVDIADDARWVEHPLMDWHDAPPHGETVAAPVLVKGSPTAKWLHRFYAVQESPLPYKAETIYELCGTKIAEQRIFRSRLKKALDELVEAKFLESYSVGPRPSYLVSVKKPGVLAVK